MTIQVQYQPRIWQMYGVTHHRKVRDINGQDFYKEVFVLTIPPF